jgi:hypothetical protein
MLCPPRVSLPLIKRCDMFLENNAAYPVGCANPLQIVMSVWYTFLNLNLLGRVWQPGADYDGCLAVFKFKIKCTKCPLLSAQAVTPDQITHQKSLQ